MKSVVIVLLLQVLTSCNVKTDVEDITYEFSENLCTTGKKTFNSTENMCRTIQNEASNNYCALTSRQNYFASKCSGIFTSN